MSANVTNVVRLRDLFCLERVVFPLGATSKNKIIEELADTLVASGQLKRASVGRFVKEILAREKLGTTAIGKGIAIPHVRSDMCENLVGVLGCSKNGVSFDSLDKKPTHAVFMLAAPLADKDQQIRILGRIATVANHDNFLNFFLQCKSAQQVVELLEEIEEQIPAF